MANDFGEAMLCALEAARDEFEHTGVPVNLHYPTELGFEKLFVVDPSKRGKDA